MGVVSPGENRGEIFVLGRRPQTIGCCCCCCWDTGEFCTDLFLIPLAGVDAGVVDPLPTAPPVRLDTPMALPPPTPLLVLASPDNDGDAAMLGTFSFDARSIAEFRRIMIVLVCGSISNRCSLMFCWLSWFRLSRVSVEEEDDEEGDSSFGNICT